MADIVTEIVTGFLGKLSDPIAFIGILGILIGCVIRTLHPFARKVWLGEFQWNEFSRTYVTIFISAFGTSAVFYFALAPLTVDLVVELILGILLGLAGNELFTEFYKDVIGYFYEGKNSRAE